MKQINIKTLASALFLMAGLNFTACTGSFEDWNVNPDEVTPEQMDRDNLKTGSYFSQMQRGVFMIGGNRGGEYQITQALAGDLFAGYASAITNWSYASYNNNHYNLYYGWYNALFNDAYTEIMQPWYSIKKVAENETPAVYALATVIKVFGMERVTDTYGPIPYTKFGGDLSVSYDSQEEVYNTFFAELGSAIDVLTNYFNANKDSKLLATYDYVYNGNVERWIKFANTLRLRLAMRVSYVNPALATQQAAAAINHPVGLMAAADDTAAVHQSANFTFRNPLWEISESFQDSRIGASIDAYMNGYNDPRRASYFLPANEDGGFHGVRLGFTRYTAKANYLNAASGVAFTMNSDMPWMDAAEAFFLQAEAKLRFDIGSASAQSLYEQGIRVSFASKGASGADAYLANADLTPAEYVDPTGYATYNADSPSDITVAWDEEAGMEKNLERIITQKWIALYPDGQEAWTEFRRTGYPKLFPTVTNQSNGTINTDVQIRRLPFPTTEYERNSANVQAALSLLKGADNGGTKLWWDAK